MIVKYLGDNNAFLIKNKEYVLLAMDFKGTDILFSVKSDENNIPILVESKNFEVVNGSLPNGWAFQDYGNNMHMLQPQEFFGNFWDDYHDGDLNAEKIFKEVINKIYEFHGMKHFYKELTEKEPLKEHEWWKEYLEEDKHKEDT